MKNSKNIIESNKMTTLIYVNATELVFRPKNKWHLIFDKALNFTNIFYKRCIKLCDII